MATRSTSQLSARAARAIASGDPLGALGLVGLSDDAPSLVIRGIAYAQMGDFELAREALLRAIAAGVDGDARTKARALAALVEIDLETGDPAAAERAASISAAELDRLGDRRNAAMQRLVRTRAQVLLGHLDDARWGVDVVLEGDLDPDLQAVALLARAEIAIRAVATTRARSALSEARQTLTRAPNPVLARALVALEQELSRPIARLLRGGQLREADLFAVEAASSGEVLLVDGCRRLVIGGRVTIPLARRPILFALLSALARAWPAGVPRDELAARTFDARKVNASHRSRLRVEIGRLRKALDGLGAEPTATAEGYVLSSAREVVHLLPPSDDEAAVVGLLLGDGAAWSAQGLAEHAGMSKRTVQRALADLVENGHAVRTGAGKSVRYLRPGTPVASRMVLLGLLPSASPVSGPSPRAALGPSGRRGRARS